MKIRTNFVTNSSSYSSAEIRIDNPVLLEILQEYKAKGAFKPKDDGDWPTVENMVAVSERDLESDNPAAWEYLDDMDDEPLAVQYCDNEVAEVFFAPEKVEDVLPCILRMMDAFNQYKNEELYEEFKNEVISRKSEIDSNYIEVEWEASNDSYDECEPDDGEETSWSFHYEKP